MAETLADLIEARFGLPTAAGAGMAAEGPLAGMLSHRTHRRFTDRPVAEETLELILAAGFSAPTKSDLQQASVVLVKEPARRAAIQALIPGMPWIATAPVFMVFCGDSRRIRRICELRGKPFANDHMDAFLNAVSDTAMVLQNAVNAAEVLGLGSCPISHVRNHIDEVGEILELPAHVFPLAGLCIGYPSQAGWVSMRLPLKVTVHTDRYDDCDFIAELDAYDRRRDARFSIPVEKQRQPGRFGCAAFYGWSEDKARQVAERERDSLRGYLERQGFDLS
jgi:FMN reductase [NAD(P)H]